ncbi:TPA: hypothetical protein R1765_001945 [Campylobacter coli]|nr:hypothetical protein [Campylobacter coli]
MKEIELKNIEKAYEIKKELWAKEKGKRNKIYRIFSEEIFQDFIEMELFKLNESSSKKYYLMQIYRHGYQNIRSINEKFAFKEELDEDDIDFIKTLKEADILYALNEIYDRNEVKKILKQCKINNEKDLK